MGCAETYVLRLPDNDNQAARDALAHRPPSRVRVSPGPRHSLTVVPLIGDKRYYGEATAWLPRGSRPIRGIGPGGWLWVKGQRLAFWGSQPGLELSTETPASGN